MVDIARSPRQKNRRSLIWLSVILGLAVLAWRLFTLDPALPSVDREAIVLGTVERGTLPREVRGTGNLVPERVRWISATTAGRIERLWEDPGATVDPQTVLLELSNPDIELQVLDIRRQLAAVEADLATLRTQLDNQILTQKGVIAALKSEHDEARRQANAHRRLMDRKVITELELQNALGKETELVERLSVGERRLRILSQAKENQLAAKKAQLTSLRDIEGFREQQLDSMRVTAGEAGILQSMDLNVGQWVQPGELLAKVARPDRLKAEVRIAEVQAKDVQVGQRAVVDTRTGSLIEGRVAHIDPAVQAGFVLIEVSLDGDLPRGVRPDLTVDARIELERLENVLFTGRPVFGASDSLVEMFKLDPTGDVAVRVKVQLGRASLQHIEIVAGLGEDETVILNDMRRFDGVDRIRLQ